MWDGIDCHRCRMLGWMAESVDDQDLRFVHLRPMGSSQKGIWTGRVRAGYGQYFMGTSPLYFLASAVFRLVEHPALLGSVAMLWGYFSSAVRSVPRYDDPGFRPFLRRYQLACLMRGKREATRRLNAAQEPRWLAATGTGRAGAAREPARSSRAARLPVRPAGHAGRVQRCLEWCPGPARPTP